MRAEFAISKYYESIPKLQLGGGGGTKSSEVLLNNFQKNPFFQFVKKGSENRKKSVD